MVLILGALIIVLAAVAVYRRVDVRLALLLAALALGTLGGNPLAIVRVFLETFSNERFVVPICTAMGFAYVLRHTQCDQHLVHLLLRPIQHVRWLLIPGTVVVGFLVNIPVVSQTSTAVTLGAVAIPLLLAARISPVTVGATLLLGASIGGELLNPGAPELRTVVQVSTDTAEKLGLPSPGLDGRKCVARLLPLDLIGLGVGTAVFWLLSARAERREPHDAGGAPATVPEELSGAIVDSSRGLQPRDASPPVQDGFRLNLVKAMVPLVPLALLFLTGPPLQLIEVERTLLVPLPAGRSVPTPAELGLFDSRLIGSAMLIGVVVAALASLRQAGGVAAAFFDGAGYGFTHIISLIVTANCFGKGMESIGLAELLGGLIELAPWLLMPLAGLLPLGFAALCGSGMATTQSLFHFFAEPALLLGIDPAHVGAVVSLASAAGRTMSPVAAVTLMCATLTGTSAFELSRRVVMPLLAAVAAVVVAAMIMTAIG